MTPIGIFPRTSETVLARFPQDTQPYFLVAKGSREEKWILEFIEPEYIVSFEIDEKHGYHSNLSSVDIFEHSNLLELLHEKHIQHILITIAKSKERDAWAREHGITLIYTDLEKQYRYENKLWFDPFLEKHKLPKPRSMVYRFDRDGHQIPFSGKVVIQRGESLGNDGTFILDDITHIDRLIEKEILKKDEEYLLREFIYGSTFGIELFISSEVLALSQARIQCFYQHEEDEDIKWFSGTQFVPSSTLSPALKQRLTETLTTLAKLLAEDGYLGYAGIDVMVDKDDNIFILECNPRFTTSSPLLMQYPETLSGIKTSEIFIHEFLEAPSQQKGQTVVGYPESEFEGSVLRLILRPHSTTEMVTIEKEHPIGLYSYNNGEITFITSDIRQFHQHPGAFTYYCDLKKGETYKKNTYIADLFANFPLYHANGKINDDGRKIIEYFSL